MDRKALMLDLYNKSFMDYVILTFFFNFVSIYYKAIKLKIKYIYIFSLFLYCRKIITMDIL